MHPSRPARILELDALRGLAALAVVLYHYTTRYGELFGRTDPLALSVPWGHFGVDLFFMLSGFVILMTLERSADAWSFAWGRFSRLYPAYWAAAALTCVIVWLCGLPGQEVSTHDALLNVSMVQALLGANHIDGAYWSLQAELIFYANMLVLYRCGAFRRPEVAVALWLVTAVAVRQVQAPVEAVSPLVGELLSKFSTVASLRFIPLFSVGILLYASRGRSRYSGTAIGLIVAALITTAWFEGVSTALIDAALAGILCAAVSGGLPRLTSRPFVALGALSYTLYLIHQNVGYVVIREIESWGIPPLWAIFVAVAVAVGLASWLHRAVEQPAMRRLRGVRETNAWQRVVPASADV